MLKHIALGVLFFSLFLFSLIGSSPPNIITGLANLNETVQCGTCNNWTDIACGATEQDSFGCEQGYMYQIRTCNVVFNPTSSPTILKITPLEMQTTGLAILNSEDTCTARCIISDLCSINNPPSQPIALTPENKEVNIPINYELQWISEDSDNDQILYDVYFGDLNKTDLLVSDLNDTSYSINNLELNKIYKWKVIAKDNHSQVPSETWWFKTENFEGDSHSSSNSVSASFTNPAAKENSPLTVPKSNETANNTKNPGQESLVIEETTQDLAKKEVSSITGNAIKFVVSNNNIIFQSISIILIALTIFFIKRKK